MEGRLSCSPSPDPSRDPLRPVGSPLAQLPSVLTRGSSSASLHNSIIRSTIYHLMLHSLDPLGEGKQGLLTPACLSSPCHASPPATGENLGLVNATVGWDERTVIREESG